MGSQERKEKARELRRQEMIEAAEKVFFAKGYDLATMDDVARAAEFSKRTLYIYFSSKEQLYFEIMTRGYKQLLQMLRDDTEKKDRTDAIGELKQMALTLHRFSLTHPDYFRAIMEYENGELDFKNDVPDPSREACYELGEQVMGRLIGILNKGMAEGSVRSDIHPEKTALVLWACTVGVFNTAGKKGNYIRNYYNTTSEDLVAEAYHLLIRSIRSGQGESDR
ncbi:putative HTH-type transcriptional regulator YfiR [compost metagenome]|uniref:TetR/AcrR family transcriptional regulator n=1 Tax=Paenibacillus rhizolycopersici TaxID=2780073 RepID=A0ABS2H0T5_9BACL|nr:MULTISPECIES: TetR/AcrR family transcriptional regulator [Paenibacillus]MBM6994955.1 TetR/AcrR family transcriptional regulator [Paenibacillus rhizolycopersici]MUG85903.1 TetR family transcriptional regulator [Paenibacillus timonensis]GIP48274.1 AcrR family transcriptional regulator [Paenibacillus sp. J53TS2]